jgi:hypothetical protein
MGGIAFKLNGHDAKAGASPAKCDLLAYILQRAGIKDVFKDTPPSADFTIWHRKLKKGVS